MDAVDCELAMWCAVCGERCVEEECPGPKCLERVLQSNEPIVMRGNDPAVVERIQRFVDASLAEKRSMHTLVAEPDQEPLAVDHRHFRCLGAHPSVPFIVRLTAHES